MAAQPRRRRRLRARDAVRRARDLVRLLRPARAATSSPTTRCRTCCPRRSSSLAEEPRSREPASRRGSWVAGSRIFVGSSRQPRFRRASDVLLLVPALVVLARARRRVSAVGARARARARSSPRCPAGSIRSGTCSTTCSGFGRSGSWSRRRSPRRWAVSLEAPVGAFALACAISVPRDPGRRRRLARRPGRSSRVTPDSDHVPGSPHPAGRGSRRHPHRRAESRSPAADGPAAG